MVLEDCGKFDFQASQQHWDTYGWHALWLGQPLGNEQQTVKSTVNDRTTERQNDKKVEKKKLHLYGTTPEKHKHILLKRKNFTESYFRIFAISKIKFISNIRRTEAKKILSFYPIASVSCTDKFVSFRSN